MSRKKVDAVHQRIHDCSRLGAKMIPAGSNMSNAKCHAMRNISGDAYSAGVSIMTMSDESKSQSLGSGRSKHQGPGKGTGA